MREKSQTPKAVCVKPATPVQKNIPASQPQMRRGGEDLKSPHSIKTGVFSVIRDSLRHLASKTIPRSGRAVYNVQPRRIFSSDAPPRLLLVQPSVGANQIRPVISAKCDAVVIAGQSRRGSVIEISVGPLSLSPTCHRQAGARGHLRAGLDWQITAMRQSSARLAACIFSIIRAR